MTDYESKRLRDALRQMIKDLRMMKISGKGTPEQKKKLKTAIQNIFLQLHNLKMTKKRMTVKKYFEKYFKVMESIAPERPPKPGFKWEQSSQGNWYEKKINNGDGHFDAVHQTLTHYQENPRGKNQGNCHNAVRDLAKHFLEMGFDENDMQVQKIKTYDKDGKDSNHVILKLGDYYFDPTGKQYNHIHKGNHDTIMKELPKYYKKFGEPIKVDPYIR